ncbi:hypothetical protein COCON_G00234110 [Conger conger]|uniref:Ig-like domain-containing protein n=1 Tax=Conger conger TaxID=82655 RepID=A0A9Q1HIX7_CONCO|nr:hypothetical protein COCON_G00234110 [Conger conger]
MTIRDDKKEGAFYITMTDLTKDDEGPYKCGISQLLVDENVSVYVRVNEGDTMPDLWGPRNVSGMASSSQTITCQYAADYTKSVKYWCKDSGTDVCSPEVNTHDKEREDRTQIRDDPSNREFVITIRNLTGNDTGLYYCGVKQSSSHKDNRVPVNLNVDAAEKPEGSRNPNNRPIPGELKPAPECNGHKVEIHTRLVDNPSYDCFCIQDQKTPGG